MKKSEKIELRVNHDEKERLARIAERRGQTISDVVREALADDLGGGPRVYPKWPGFVALAALGVSALALWAGFSKMNQSKSPVIQTAELSVRYSEPGQLGLNEPLQTIIPVVDGFEKTYEFSASESDYKLELMSKMDEAKTLHYDAQICRLSENECVDIPIPTFSAVPGQASHQVTGGVSAMGPADEIITLKLLVQGMPVSTTASGGK